MNKILYAFKLNKNQLYVIILPKYMYPVYKCCVTNFQRLIFFQTFWDDVRAEMIQEKGIDPIAVDKIGKYVELKGMTNVLFLFICNIEILLK